MGRFRQTPQALCPILFHVAEAMYIEGTFRRDIVSSKCAEEAVWAFVVLEGGICEVHLCGVSPYEIPHGAVAISALLGTLRKYSLFLQLLKSLRTMAQELDFSSCEVSTQSLAEGAPVACLATSPPAPSPSTPRDTSLASPGLKLSMVAMSHDL